MDILREIYYNFLKSMLVYKSLKFLLPLIIALLFSSFTGAEETYSSTNGAVFEINADIIEDIDQFDKKPKVYITDGSLNSKKKSAKVVKIEKDKVTCEWKAKVSSGAYSLIVEPKVQGEKIDPVTVTESFNIEPPEIYELSPSSAGENQAVKVTGKYFGTSPPKAWFEYQEVKNGKTVTKIKRCKIDNKNLTHNDYRGKPSCMDPDSCESEFIFTVPKGITGDVECTFKLDNKIGVASADFNSASYLIVDLITQECSENNSLPADLLTNDIYKTSKIVFRKIAAGTFTMGAVEDESVYVEPQHQVTLTKSFYMGIFEVTKKQYEYVTAESPSVFNEEGAKTPVESVNWEMIRGGSWPNGDPGSTSFMGQLRAMIGDSYKFDLPTEAQWEYACRATTTMAYNDYTKNDGEGSSCPEEDTDKQDENLDPLAWYANNAYQQGLRYQEVGKKQPNKFGLYDMHGNVGEWCLDWWGQYPSSPVNDPEGPTDGGNTNSRIVRGGSWGQLPVQCRSAYRESHKPSGNTCNYLGFRIVLPAE